MPARASCHAASQPASPPPTMVTRSRLAHVDARRARPRAPPARAALATALRGAPVFPRPARLLAAGLRARRRLSPASRRDGAAPPPRRGCAPRPRRRRRHLDPAARVLVEARLPAAALARAAAHRAEALRHLLGDERRAAARARLDHGLVPGDEGALRVAVAAEEGVAARERRSYSSPSPQTRHVMPVGIGLNSGCTLLHSG